MKPSNVKYASVFAVALAAMALTGCASNRVSAPFDITPRSFVDVQQSAAVSITNTGRPIVALVLGGGGLRGFAHIGVLRALEEAGVRPDVVVGTSAGALVGAAYASGMTPDEIESAARSIKLSSLIDLTWSSSGFMRGNNLAAWVNNITNGVDIEKFPIRFAAVATDLQSGQAVLIDSGSAGRAIQASAAVPGVNVPVPYKNGHLIDGGITSLVPVRFARAMGADFVIAVDIYCNAPRNEGLSIPTILSKVMHTQSCLVAAPEMAQADVLIAPTIKVSSMSDKDEQERAIRAGYDATRAVLRSESAKNSGTDPAPLRRKAVPAIFPI